MPITLMIEAARSRSASPRARVEVDASAFVGTFVAALVEEWGYPRADAAGRSAAA